MCCNIYIYITKKTLFLFNNISEYFDSFVRPHLHIYVYIYITYLLCIYTHIYANLARIYIYIYMI